MDFELGGNKSQKKRARRTKIPLAFSLGQILLNRVGILLKNICSHGRIDGRKAPMTGVAASRP